MRVFNWVAVFLAVIVLLIGCTSEDTPVSEPETRQEETAAPVEARETRAEEDIESKPTPMTSADYLALVEESVARTSMAEMSVEERVQRIKEAVVLVRSQRAVGTGFVFRERLDDPLRVITAYSLIDDPDGRPIDVVQVVFNPGTPREVRRRAKTIAGSVGASLAILEVGDLPLGQPYLEISQEPARVTEPVVVVGFPFGDVLSLNQRLPVPTVSTGTVSSVRVDEGGVTAAVQLDIDVNPGHAGAPVVDERGGVLGIVGGAIPTTDVSFAIPVDNLKLLTEGMISDLLFVGNPEGSGKVIRMLATLEDPFSRITRIGANGLQRGVAPSEGALRWPYRPIGRTLAMGYPQGRRSVLEWETSWTEPMWLQGWYENEHGRQLLEPTIIHVGTLANTRRADALYGDLDDHDLDVEEASSYARPKPIGRTLLGPAKVPDGLRIHQIAIEVGRWTPPVAWATDGTALFVAESTGVIRKLSHPGYTEELRIDLKTTLSSMDLSNSGLVVTMSRKGIVILLDQWSLEPIRAIRVGMARRAVTARSHDLGFVETVPGDYLVIVDLEEGRQLGAVSCRDLRLQLPEDDYSRSITEEERGFGRIAATPDGKYLLVFGNERLHRLRIDDPLLVYEEIGVEIGGILTGSIDISPDGEYVAAVTIGGNSPHIAEPEFGYKEIWVSSVDNLSDPILVLPPRPRLRAIAFDPVKKRIYAGKVEKREIVVYGQNQRQVGELDLSDYAGGILHILPHPSGTGIVVQTTEDLLWVEW